MYNVAVSKYDNLVASKKLFLFQLNIYVLGFQRQSKKRKKYNRTKQKE